MAVVVGEEGWAFAFAARSQSEVPAAEVALRFSVGVASRLHSKCRRTILSSLALGAAVLKLFASPKRQQREPTRLAVALSGNKKSKVRGERSKLG